MLSAPLRRPQLVLVVLAVVLSLSRLGAGALRDYDEALYANVTHDILHLGHWLSLSVAGRYYSHKPPLLFWLMALSFKVLGETEAAARLPAALFGVAGVWATSRIAARLRGEGTGLLAGLILISAPQWLEMSRQAMLDVPLASSLALSGLALMSGAWLAAGLACGAALLIKGPLAVLAIAVALTVAMVRRPHAAMILRAALTALAVAAPWHLHQLLTHGTDFTGYYFGVNVVGRLTSALEGHGNPWWYYLDRIFTHWLSPWHLAGAAAILVFGWRVLRGRERELIYILLWFVLPLAVFSMARTKLYWYATPLYPPLAILTAAWVAEVSLRRQWLKVAAQTLAVLTILQSALYSFHLGRHSPTNDTREVLKTLPPISEAPVLELSRSIPEQAARFYARRPLHECSPDAPPPTPSWILAPAEERPRYPGRPLAAGSRTRVLLGPRKPEA